MPRKPAVASIADQRPAAGGAAAVDRALSLLGAFRAGDTALTLTELSHRTRLYMSTVLRLLASLEHARLVQRRPDGKYGLGPEVARLHGIYTASFELEALVMPALRALVEATGESAAFHVRQAQQRLCLYRVDSPHPLRDHTRAGDLLPLDRGAGGRLLQAFDGAKGARYDDIRKQGIAVTIGDRVAELAGISAPVLDGSGRCLGAVTLSMPAQRFKKRHERIVLATARSLSATVGGVLPSGR
ncbi:MAG: IclR family transcriptional regulator, partial [Betaproteobacteria bacterium]